MTHPLSFTSPRGGFTLAELAVVLLIVAVLAGGVLAGRDLIAAAEVRNVISQKRGFETAVNLFTEKFSCLPGDCPNRKAGFDTTGRPDFPGRGTYAVCWNGDENEDGFKWFWRDLSRAGLIGDPYPGATSLAGDGCGVTIAGWNSPTCAVCRGLPYTDVFGQRPAPVPRGGWLLHKLDGPRYAPGCPQSRMANGSYPQVTPGFAFLLTTSNGSGVPNAQASGVLDAAAAAAIDAKADDGRPLTGAFVVTASYFYSDPACSGDGLKWAPNAPWWGGSPVGADGGYNLRAGGAAIGVDGVWAADFGP